MVQSCSNTSSKIHPSNLWHHHFFTMGDGDKKKTTVSGLIKFTSVMTANAADNRMYCVIFEQGPWETQKRKGISRDKG